ncbi:hypothetical protein ACHAO8_010258 [Botrytis cinerea]
MYMQTMIPQAENVLGGTFVRPVETEAYPGKTILKMGIFEKVMTPEWESFVKDRHPWISGLEGAVQFKAESGGEKV